MILFPVAAPRSYPRPEQRHRFRVLGKRASVVQLQLTLFTFHHDRVEQREICAQQQRGDPRVSCHSGAQCQNRAAKIQRIARVRVRTVLRQDLLFVQISRSPTADQQSRGTDRRSSSNACGGRPREPQHDHR
jgi:hypothetical protein